MTAAALCDVAECNGSGDSNSLQLQPMKPSAKKEVPAVETPRDHAVHDFRDETEETLQLPVVDISGLANGDATARERIVREITEACETWGMFQIVNHGVPQRLLQKLDKHARDFFDLPLDVKERVNLDQPEGMNYQQQGFLRRLQADPLVNSWRENLAYASAWKETRAMIDRVWPNGNVEFAEFLHEYLETMEKFGMTLMEILAEGLGLESDFYTQHLRTTDSSEKRFRWRVNFYPQRPDADLTLGISSHTDPNLLTLLSQDEVSGLQAKKGDRWVDVPPIPGALTINVGDSLEAWSNGRFKSVVHRVVVSTTRPRFSWVFLLTPPGSLLMHTPSKLIDDKRPQLFKPLTYEGMADNLCAEVLAARMRQDFPKLVPKRIFYDYALVRPEEKVSVA